MCDGLTAGETIREAVGEIQRPFHLSKRQREVLMLAAQGLTDYKIAETLGISMTTAINHLIQARIRLKANNTAEAVAIALKQKLISVPPKEGDYLADMEAKDESRTIGDRDLSGDGGQSIGRSVDRANL